MNVRPATGRDIPELLSLVRRYWDFEGIEGFAALRIELVLQSLLAEPRRTVDSSATSPPSPFSVSSTRG